MMDNDHGLWYTWIIQWWNGNLTMVSCFYDCQICVICKQIHGSCTQCSKCSTYYHAMCASRAGYRMEVSIWFCHVLSIFPVLVITFYFGHGSWGAHISACWRRVCKDLFTYGASQVFSFIIIDFLVPRVLCGNAYLTAETEELLLPGNDLWDYATDIQATDSWERLHYKWRIPIISLLPLWLYIWLT